MLQRLRLAIEQGSFEKLSGEFEADETYIGGKAHNMPKSKREEKITVSGTSGWLRWWEH
jgi:hypothetical protein